MYLGRSSCGQHTVGVQWKLIFTKGLFLFVHFCACACVCVHAREHMCVLLALVWAYLTSCLLHSDSLSRYREKETALCEAPGEMVADPDVEKDVGDGKLQNDLQDQTERYSATDSMKIFL